MITYRVRIIQKVKTQNCQISFLELCIIQAFCLLTSPLNFFSYSILPVPFPLMNSFLSILIFYFKFLFSRCVCKNYYIMFSNRSKNLLILLLFLTIHCAIAADCGDCQNCKTVNRKNECVQCMEGYRLDATGSSCIQVQQASFQESSSSSARIATSIADLDSSSFTSSTKAVLGTNNIDPNCDIVDLNGMCRKCLDKFYLSSSTKKCQGISPLCKKWDQQGKCLSCVVGYSVNADFKCVSAVLKTLNYQSSNKEIIAQSSFNPQNFDSSKSETQQSSSTSSQQTSTTTTFQSSSSSSETSVNPSDQSNKQSESIFVVTIPQVRRVVSSITDAPSTKVETKKSLIGIPYNFQNFTGQVFTVDPYCRKYQGRVCKYCEFRYVLLGGNCKKVSNSCSKWNDLGKCTVCYPGFDLKDQGQCVQTSTEILSQKFDGATVISDNNTVSKIQNVTANSTTSTSSSETTIKTVIEKPVQIRQIISSIKFIEPKPVANCDMVGSDGLCSRCKFRYYNDNGACKEVSILCKAWSLTTGACTQCYDGYSVSDSTCMKNQSQVQYEEFMAKNKKKIESETTAANIPNCALAKKGVCETCSFRYYNLNGLCMAVSDLCNTWNEAGQCTSCQLDFILSTTYKGLCVSKPITISPSFADSGLNINNVVTQTIQIQTQKIDNQIVSNNNSGCAVIASNGSCSKCALRYVKNNDGCKKVSDLCSAWNLTTGGCTDCYPGSSLNGSECVVSKNLKRLI